MSPLFHPAAYDEGYEQFKIDAVLKEARKPAGLTQDELARRLKTKKTAISRIEHHAEDIRLSTSKESRELWARGLR